MRPSTAVLARIHTRKEAAMFLVVDILHAMPHHLILARCLVLDVLGGSLPGIHRPGVEILPVKQGAAAILFAVQIRKKAQGVFGFVFVDGNLGVGTDHERKESGIADEHKAQAKQARMQDHAVFPIGVAQPPYQSGHQHHKIDNRARIERQADGIDKKYLEIAGQFNRPRHDAPKDGGQQDQRNAYGNPKAFLGMFEFLVVDDEHHGGNHQQVEQVNADGKPYQERDKDNPAQVMRLVRHGFPFENRPKGDGGKEGRHGIYLTLGRRKPERIAERVGQGAYRAANVNHYLMEHARFPVFERNGKNLTGQHRDGPEQEQYRETAAQGRKHIDGKGGVLVVSESEYLRQAAQNLESGRSGRMPHHEFARGADIFSAIPPAYGSFGGGHEHHRGDRPDEPADDVIPFGVILHRSTEYYMPGTRPTLDRLLL